ncbi:polysaccharide biosynthesis tyrosine autokinase [Pseudarthrobacter sp. NBSH8]|uniref:polysaccharide biosynthesis tyrosine autokinase n=1 Tax=Pseudarthrobacter sp. NBSH8 TaxID=2596911 RepID=UPI001624A406|nr:polysaccharide biosynthesis tyrosine autokinase [Pseudarthrobacter sp. NBSH8]QNE15579.1 polysaccharide biosynthesis tyrosine autokinase [Pseudarthrobacter sp. NBSH8]
MDLHDYLRVLRRNWALILAITLASLLTGGAASVLVKPTYTAETQLFVAIQGSGSITEMQQGNTFSQARVQSYVKTVTTPVVLQPVIDDLGLTDSADELANRVKASADLNTVLISIAVADESPVQAAAAAQAIASSLVRAVDSLEKPKNGGTSPVSLSIITPAKAPVSPSSPNTRLNLFLSVLIGLAAGVGVSMLRSSLDNRIRGEADLRRVTDAPLLGGISFDQDATKKPLLTQSAPQSSRAESFRQLRTNLQFANVSGTAKSVLVTSSLPGEGKSTTATNLAIALAQAGQSVCLVDADLRRPMINEYLGLERNAGLTTALVRAADVNDLLQPWGDDSLYVLTSGEIPPNPSELLGSEAMGQLLGRLEHAFDIVVVDAPPLLPVTDAAVLSQQVGGVVVVIGSQAIKQPELEKSLGALQMVGANLLGVVLNLLPVKGPDAYAYSYNSYDSHGPNLPLRSRKKNAPPESRTLLETRLSEASEDRIPSSVSPVDSFKSEILSGQPRESASFPARFGERK